MHDPIAGVIATAEPFFGPPRSGSAGPRTTRRDVHVAYGLARTALRRHPGLEEHACAMHAQTARRGRPPRSWLGAATVSHEVGLPRHSSWNA